MGGNVDDSTPIETNRLVLRLLVLHSKRDKRKGRNIDNSTHRRTELSGGESAAPLSPKSLGNSHWVNLDKSSFFKMFQAFF